jgi:predicted peptidase
MRLVYQLIDQLLVDQPIDRERLYIAGLSMGGYGTWHAVGLRPKFWAAAIPVCGGADLDWAEKLSDTPLWVIHGDKDQAVPVENSRRIVAKLRQSHVSVVYSEYPGVGHDSWTQTFADQKVYDWLFAQRRRKS